MSNKYIPNEIAMSVFEIDYEKLYNKLGKRVIVFDLDNTLISYFEEEPSEELIKLGQKLLDMGFKVFVFTNNHKSRIDKFMKSFPATSYGYHAGKPRIKKITLSLFVGGVTDFSEIVMIGDQMLTDILCANRMEKYSILVKSISRESEHLYTRINRLREKYIIKKYAKENFEFACEIEKIVNKGKKKWLNA